MASLSVTLGKVSCSLKATALKNPANQNFSNVKLMSFGTSNTFPSLRSSSLQICCAAKPETVSKVMEIVKTQLALTDEVAATLKPDTKFSELGADSLDTVELVMSLEEEYGISVEEDNSQNILTVQDAADIIEKLVSEKAAAAN